MLKNTMFMIIGGVFIVFCLLSYLGPRTLEAFIDPPEQIAAPIDKSKKYTKPGDYTLDRKANVLHEQKQRDNSQLKRISDMFRINNVVEGLTTDCGVFGCCEKLGIPKSDSVGSNCNGFCPYPKDMTDAKKDTTPTSGSVPPDTLTPNPLGSTNTVFIAPPVNEMSEYADVTQFESSNKSRNDSSNGKCGTCPEPQPCPSCARCPEPSFDCKKVPNYSSTNSEYLPMPVLSDFSSFGM
jgi:hypothetical protein